MFRKVLCFSVIVLVFAVHFNEATVLNRQPQFSIKAEMNKAFDESCNVGTFLIPKSTDGTGIADCLEHCLTNCRCKSFEVCNGTQCELCSTNKNETASLLRDKDGCIYAMYEILHLAGGFQKINEQCSEMSCLLKYNCCQQSGLCPKNKICKPVYNITQPWKRYTCECPDGYHGDNCDEPIRSCRGYSNSAQHSGVYKVLDSLNLMYQVYCDLDSENAWTLVQSYSFARYNSTDFIKNSKAPLFRDENAPQWSGYRLSKERMQSVRNDSGLRLRFTCNYEKHREINSSDYVELSLQQGQEGNGKIIDALSGTSNHSFPCHGKIKGIGLDGCQVLLQQSSEDNLYVNILNKDNYTECEFKLPTKTNCNVSLFNYFGTYNHDCLDEKHRCVEHDNSTTQLWFGN